MFFEGLWETERIWGLPTAVVEVGVEELVWHLELTVWSTVRGEPRFDLAPATVIARPGAFPRHWEKIQRVDVSFPLEMFENGGRWIIIDGYHRLARHYLRGSGVVAVRRHSAELWSRIRR